MSYHSKMLERAKRKEEREAKSIYNEIFKKEKMLLKLSSSKKVVRWEAMKDQQGEYAIMYFDDGGTFKIRGPVAEMFCKGEIPKYKMCAICDKPIDNLSENPLMWGVEVPYFNEHHDTETKNCHIGCLTNAINDGGKNGHRS